MTSHIDKLNKDELKTYLLRSLEELKQVKEAVNNRFYNVGPGYQQNRKQAIAVPLQRDEVYSIYDRLVHLVSCNHGGHKVLSTNEHSEWCELVIEPNEQLLPQFVGYVVHYSYSDQDGTFFQNDHVWGLLELKK